MGSGAGHVMDMNNRLKQNRALRTSNKAKFRENNRNTIYSKNNTKSKKLSFKTISQEKLNVIKQQICIRAKKQNRSERIIGFICILIVFLILQWVIF